METLLPKREGDCLELGVSAPERPEGCVCAELAKDDSLFGEFRVPKGETKGGETAGCLFSSDFDGKPNGDGKAGDIGFLAWPNPLRALAPPNADLPSPPNVPKPDADVGVLDCDPFAFVFPVDGAPNSGNAGLSDPNDMMRL